jgi:hypothetical protein
MSNYAWVCFSCRTASRRSPVAKNVRCRQCARPCECLGYKSPVPPKARAREWAALAEAFYGSRRRYSLCQQKLRVRRIHDTEREIARLELLPANEGRTDAIKRLRKQLEQLRA